MTPDEYVNKVVAKYHVETGDHSPIRQTAMAFKGLGEEWASGCLRSVGISGSFAKLTAVSSSLAGHTTAPTTAATCRNLCVIP